jgi:putative redox protein
MPIAEVEFAGGMKFVGHSESGHSISIDSAPEVGGQNQGVRPMELTLIALGGCTGIDVVSILNKMRIPFEDFRMDIDGTRQPDHPKTYRTIQLNYRFQADESASDKISRAVHLSQEKYCSVSAILAATAAIEANIYLNGKLLETLPPKA